MIAQGPVASQEIIKQFGTNGGGFFNANSAHPFENPTPLSNFLEMFAIFAISVGPDLHARRDDRIAAARLGGLGGDGVPVPRRRDDRLLGRGARQSAARGSRRRSDRERAVRRAATWKARKSASASPTRRSSPPSRPTPAAARSTPCTTPSRRSAAWCRSSTSCSAR